MKHLTLKVVLFLLLGAIINIAVAWGCARLPAPTRIGEYLSERDRNRLLEQHPLGPWSKQPHYEGWRSIRTGRTSIHISDGAVYDSEVIVVPGILNDPMCGIGVVQTGWPFRSLQKVNVFTIFDLLKSGRAPESVFETLPKEALASGFAINTVFYAAIAWLLFAIPSTLRHWRRLRRGLCPVCAYPIGTSQVCTECGKLVNRPSQFGDDVERTSCAAEP